MRFLLRLHKDSSVRCEFVNYSEEGESQREREAVSTGCERSTALEAVTREGLVKTQQRAKDNNCCSEMHSF